MPARKIRNPDVADLTAADERIQLATGMATKIAPVDPAKALAVGVIGNYDCAVYVKAAVNENVLLISSPMSVPNVQLAKDLFDGATLQKAGETVISVGKTVLEMANPLPLAPTGGEILKKACEESTGIFGRVTHICDK